MLFCVIREKGVWVWWHPTRESADAHAAELVKLNQVGPYYVAQVLSKVMPSVSVEALSSVADFDKDGFASQ